MKKRLIRAAFMGAIGAVVGLLVAHKLGGGSDLGIAIALGAIAFVLGFAFEVRVLPDKPDIPDQL